MVPHLRDGEAVRVRRRSNCYLPGRIVAVDYFDDSIRLHRLIAFRRRLGAWEAITRGDDAQALDAPIPLKRIIGTVESVVMVPERSLFSLGALVRGLILVARTAMRSLVSRWLRSPSVVS
jgi:hypothetical protein